jgi:multidrug efflux pump subunit AcrB
MGDGKNAIHRRICQKDLHEARRGASMPLWKPAVCACVILMTSLAFTLGVLPRHWPAVPARVVHSTIGITGVIGGMITLRCSNVFWVACSS